MVIIRFRDGTEWYKANWVFRQLAEDVIAGCGDDVDVAFAINEAKAFGTLFLDSMDRGVASRVVNVATRVAEGTLNGKLIGWLGNRPEDHEGQRVYLQALSELLAILRRQTN